MPMTVTIVSIIAIVWVYLALRPRRSLPPEPGQIHPAAYSGLREIFFQTKGEDLSLEGAERLVYGASFEVGFPPGIATVAALADGTASLYLETGGGVIGAGRHESVHRRAIAFVDCAVEHLELGAQVTESPPKPSKGEVRFHWLSDDGIRSAVALELALEAGNHPLSPLYRAGQELLEQIRLANRPVAP